MSTDKTCLNSPTADFGSLTPGRPAPSFPPQGGIMLSKTVSVVLLTPAAFGAETIPTPKGVIAHEWGTFTSVADMNGAAIRWFALGGAPKLPDFVHRPQWLGKAQYAFVRMETPVIYFY